MVRDSLADIGVNGVLDLLRFRNTLPGPASNTSEYPSLRGRSQFAHPCAPGFPEQLETGECRV